MSCLSWNCRGVGSPRTVCVFKDLLRVHKPVFVFLIETLSFANKIEDLRIRFGFDNCFSVDRVGRSGGLAILWKNSFTCEVSNYLRHHIDVNVLVNNAPAWRRSCYYGFPGRERREAWQFLRRLSTLSNLPWCVMGDFNDLMYASNKKGNSPHPQYLLHGFGETIEDCLLSEINLSGGSFTWENGRVTEAWVRDRFDSAFAYANWWSKFPLCHLQVVQTSKSDHDPIILELFIAEMSKKKFQFRFENIWLREASFIDEIKSVWNNIPCTHLLPKLLEV